MDFSQALLHMKAGYPMQRAGWNGKNMFVALVPNPQEGAMVVQELTGMTVPFDCNPYIGMWTADQKWQPGWLASQTDLLATDWETFRRPVSNRMSHEELAEMMGGYKDGAN